MKIPDAKVAVKNEWDKLDKLPSWQMTKVKSKKEVIEEPQKEKRTVHFTALMDICLLKKCGVGTKGRVVLRGDTVKHDSGLCSFHKAGIIGMTNDGRKSNGWS